MLRLCIHAISSTAHCPQAGIMQLLWPYRDHHWFYFPRGHFRIYIYRLPHQPCFHLLWTYVLTMGQDLITTMKDVWSPAVWGNSANMIVCKGCTEICWRRSHCSIFMCGHIPLTPAPQCLPATGQIEISYPKQYDLIQTRFDLWWTALSCDHN